MYTLMLKRLSSWVSQMKLYKILYNKRTAKKYGWTPNWFGATKFDDYLIEMITEFQRAHDLKADGLVGEVTYRRANTNREAFSKSASRILCNGQMIAIDWPKVKIDLLKDGTHKKYNGRRAPHMAVTHWDVCLSADSCKRVLEKRNISTHFVIDNDGTIVQLLDCNDIGWHAGIRKVNNNSIGIDFSNAYYTKYQSTYVKRGHGERPILTDSVVHGRTLKPHLGYYPQQIWAYEALLEFLNEHYDIPLACPTKKGALITSVHQPAADGNYHGVVCHYHLTKRKIDTAGLKLDEIINKLNKPSSDLDN